MKRLILNIYPGIQTHTEVSHLPFITPLSRESRGIWWTEQIIGGLKNILPYIKLDEEIDFEHISWYTNTHRGQPLAIYHAAEPGKPGHLVDGTKIPAGSGKDIPVLKGVQRAV